MPDLLSQTRRITVLMTYNVSCQDVLNAKFFNLSFRWRLSFALDIAEVSAIKRHSSKIHAHPGKPEKY